MYIQIFCFFRVCRLIADIIITTCNLISHSVSLKMLWCWSQKRPSKFMEKYWDSKKNRQALLKWACRMASTWNLSLLIHDRETSFIILLGGRLETKKEYRLVYHKSSCEAEQNAYKFLQYITSKKKVIFVCILTIR